MAPFTTRLTPSLPCRDEAITDLAVAYADIEAMQATLADSALYVRQLRQKARAPPASQHQHQHQHQRAPRITPDAACCTTPRSAPAAPCPAATPPPRPPRRRRRRLLAPDPIGPAASACRW
jgi:hypothetical protein